jgi:hypothetical protein
MKPRILLEWCDVFGVEMVDPDGFRDIDWQSEPITLERFLKDISESTIGIANKGRYEVLMDLFFQA